MTYEINSSELDKKGARESRTSDSRSAGLHFDTLFDSDTDQAGNSINEATGERIADHPNTTDNGLPMFGLGVIHETDLANSALLTQTSTHKPLTAEEIRQAELEREADKILAGDDQSRTDNE
jgi:hypothetical protein